MKRSILHTAKIKMKLKKRGVSPIIGYMLLIVVGVSMGLVIYGWLRTYVPAEITKCDEDVSLQITNYEYDCTTKIFKLEIKNNGRFNVGGYLLRATNNSNDDIANVPLGKYYDGTEEFIVHSSSFLLIHKSLQNIFPPEQVLELEDNKFNLTLVSPNFKGDIAKIQLTPVRIITNSRGNNITAICSDATITEKISCP